MRRLRYEQKNHRGRDPKEHGRNDALPARRGARCCYTPGPRPRISPMTSDTTKAMRNRKNRILAIPAAPEAMPPNPKTAAMMATMKKPIAQLSMFDSNGD